MMDMYPDGSEKILSSQRVRQRILQSEKQIANAKSREQKKSTK